MQISINYTLFARSVMIISKQQSADETNRNYSAILATLQITSYALGVYIALLFTCQSHESLIKLYFRQFSIFKIRIRIR
jgi:hypothetical protein